MFHRGDHGIVVCLDVFFFQAEDGIRDVAVTGVQTCALPICAGWDFDDVRDHYLARLFGLDPVNLRYAEHERYLTLSRVVSGEVMAAVFAEWRRDRKSVV